MCGILGLYSISGISPYKTDLQAANDIVRYRGPDGVGYVLFNTRTPTQEKGIILSDLLKNPDKIEHANLALAHRRLAIIDLSSAGLQPMSTQDRNLWITYNGEVYNYIELRSELESHGHTFTTHTDTEVILHAYQQWGEDCVNRFNGMWSFALVDLNRDKIFCSRDRFGIKPFHYFHDGSHFTFASEIKQLLMFPFIPKRINDHMVFEYLAYQAVDHGRETFFSDIFNLPPGHNLIYDLQGQKISLYRYYNPRFIIDDNASLAESAEKFHYFIKDSVRLRLRSDVKVGSCLSGGLDSSSIVCLIHDLLQEQEQSDIQHTFSSHFEDKEANELEHMETVIRATGVNAHFIYPTPEGLISDLDDLIWHQEEPFGSTSIYAQWCVFKLARENGVTVMLDGQGADETLGGYVPYSSDLYFQELLLKKRFLTLFSESKPFGNPTIPLIRSIFSKNILPVFSQQLMSILKKSPQLHQTLRNIRQRKQHNENNDTWLNPDLVNKYSEQSPFVAHQKMCMFGEHERLNNYLYQITFLHNLQALLKYEDRNSMAFSTEGRVPFLDYRLVEFLFSLPSHLKMKNGFSKYILREGMKGVIPDSIRLRKTKLGFSTPETLWQRTILYPLIQEALRDPKIGAYVNSEHAGNYLHKLIHSQQRDFTPWRWTNLSLWMKAFNLEPMYS